MAVTQELAQAYLSLQTTEIHLAILEKNPAYHIRSSFLDFPSAFVRTSINIRTWETVSSHSASVHSSSCNIFLIEGCAALNFSQ